MEHAVTPLSRGVWGILATPFAGPHREVDEASLRRQVRLFGRLPAAGVVALGVFGEGQALDSAEQHRVVEIVAEEAAPLPVVVGLSSRSTAGAVEQARLLTSAGGDRIAGVMVQVHTADSAVLGEHLKAVHDATGSGIVVQDYPAISGVHISADRLLAVVDECPFVAAIKAESPPTAAAIAELTAGTDVPVFGGLGGVGLIDELAAGAAGAMTGFSHPEGLAEALESWRSGGLDAAREAFGRWLPLVNFEAQPGIGLAIRKEVLHRRGLLTEATVRPPSRSMPESLRSIMIAHLEATRKLVAS